ncbi:carcinoembryonic antigen-related cell adhesion molecule 5 [Ictalurus punctatus]|uniref:Carcinoembryonic antigen-related cell adhesion molecule 5 n=1 Tax=Ictalurus punctatus TaxID=7998 RepID=A0A9F7TJP3_ICTPU|nr:carcinoembryonic antigen-related cell adhesion molecule 5 [Ictalurus punctatus]
MMRNDKSPKAVVTIKPDKHVFRGETVTLRCEIQGGGDTEWKYSWYKNDNTLYPTTQEFSFSSVINDAAEAVVSVSPLRWLTEGDSVTLSCEVKNSSTGWTFSWYTAVPYRNGLIEVTGRRGNVLYGSELLSDSSRGSGGSYTLTNVTVNHTGVYMCRAERGESVFHTRDSNLQPLCITGESPPVSLIINPSRTQHFTADSLTLSCEDQSDSTGWTVRGYTHNGDVILDSPVHPVTEGNPLTLRCLYHNSSISDSGVDFYKDGSVLQNKTTGEMTITTVSKSDEGFYHCKHPERGESLKSWVSVRVRPKPVVKIQPAGRVFLGETVTLTCEIQTSGSTWQYHWYRDNTELSDAAGKKTYTISDIKDSDKGDYTCNGTKSSDPKYTQTSDGVTLTISENPKPELTSDLKGAVMTGNSVNLSCTLKLQSDGWKFYWIKLTQSTETETETHSYTIRSVSVSDGGQYKCRAGRGNPVYYTHYSDALWVNVIESPKPVVIIKPDTQVFRGERVTFRCDTKEGGDTEWTYDWYRDDKTLYTSLTTQEFIISNYYSGKYTCRGRRRSDSQISKTSDSVTLTVSEKPKPTVRVNPQSSVYTGDRVTLTCNLLSTGWTFLWYKDYQESNPLSPRTTDTNTLSVTVSNEGETQYYCKARRGNYESEISDPITITVRGASPRVSLIINPSRTQHFTADSLSLSCENQSDSTGWTVRGYTHSEAVSDCSSVSGSTCNIRSLSTSHTGVYWCQSESGRCSNPVNITVHNGDVILESPVHPVTEGHPLTLRCLYRNSKISDSGVDFYKNDSILLSQTTGEMTISTVSKSDEGFYHCKHPERAESLKSWVSVRVLSDGKAPLSVLKLLSSAVAASPYVLVTIILAVKCYRARTDPVEDNRPYRVIEAEASV